MDADVDVDAAGAGGLGPRDEAMILEDLVGNEGHVADVLPGNAGAGVEIDAELVRVVEIGGADGVGMKLDAAEVDDPGEAGGVIDDELFGGATGGKGKGDGAEEGGECLWVGGALLVEGLGLRGLEAGAVDEALENDGAVLNSLKRAGRDGEVVADEVELGEFYVAGEVELGGVGDADFVPVDGEEFGVGFGVGGHGDRVSIFGATVSRLGDKDNSGSPSGMTSKKIPPAVISDKLQATVSP